MPFFEKGTKVPRYHRSNCRVLAGGKWLRLAVRRWGCYCIGHRSILNGQMLIMAFPLCEAIHHLDFILDACLSHIHAPNSGLRLLASPLSPTRNETGLRGACLQLGKCPGRLASTGRAPACSKSQVWTGRCVAERRAKAGGVARHPSDSWMGNKNRPRGGGDRVRCVLVFA